MKRQCCAAAVRHKATVRLLHVKLYRYKGNCPFCFPILLLHLLVSCHLLLMSRCNTNGVAEISGWCSCGVQLCIRTSDGHALCREGIARF
ncbi:hypothetical protein ACH3XW_5100 [Acanthocheilonema viteae]